MFISHQSILLAAARGFVSLSPCMWHDLSQMAISELLGRVLRQSFPNQMRGLNIL
jgi:hypothetical protein